MEALVIITVLLLLAILAPLAGYDSRARLHSKEEDLAAVGLTWEHLDPDRALRSTGEQSARMRRGLRALGRATATAVSHSTALLK
jgi:hypothetical protein